MIKKAPKKTHKVPQKKMDAVKELKDLAKSSRTVMIASIRNLPASQLQEAVKALRGKAVVKVPKKNLIIRAIEEDGSENMKSMEKLIEGDFAILFSNLDSFDLAHELVKNKKYIKAKAGQESPGDIEIPAGPTDLMPGPAVSDFGFLGIPISIEGGKINVKISKVIAKKGDKISPSAAELMSKLDIKPIAVALIPLVAFDNKENKIYSNININKEEAVSKLKEAYARALPFAVDRSYYSTDTIKFILNKAGIKEKTILALLENKTN